ncbi:hypothetical protein MKX03_012574 [Papaver bracteatum]|nr:hypothetical protein MKX03_012574 [Papaver bracteatum]
MAASSSLQIYSSSSLFNPYKKSSKNSNVGRTHVYNVIKLDKSASFICYASKKRNGFMDQILDYIEGGPKLRKWYGAEKLPKDGGGGVEDGEDDDFQEVEQVRDAKVTDGDSEIGQVSSSYIHGNTIALIVARAREIFFSDIESLEGVQHIVLLSQICSWLFIECSDGIQALIQSNAKKLAEKNESMVMNSSNKIPYTIIRAGLLQNTQGGQQGFNFKEGSAGQGKLSKEDAAFICVEALNAVPKRGLVVEVANGEETVSDWKELFNKWIQNADEEQLQ